MVCRLRAGAAAGREAALGQAEGAARVAWLTSGLRAGAAAGRGAAPGRAEGAIKV